MPTAVSEPVTFDSGATVSSELQVNGRRVVAVTTAVAWTTADISFEVYDALLNGWRPVTDMFAQRLRLTGVPTTESYFMILPEEADRLVANTLRLVSDDISTGAATAQGSARTLYVGLQVL